MKTGGDADPSGTHKDAVRTQVQPMIDSEVASSIVVGIYDAGKFEIYGFGTGPGGKTPTGRTVFELGAVTKVYTALLFADSVQRREVNLDTPAGELLPPGVTVPVRDKQVITLHHLVNHSSGLPPLPPSVVQHAKPGDPLAGYDENRLYADLVQTQLVAAPGERIVISEYGSGLLGVLLGRKIGSTYSAMLDERITKPLALTDTFIAVPDGAASRVIEGSDQDLAPVKPWTWGALAAAGGLHSTVRDQLAFLEAQLDAAAGSRQALRPPMRLTQEAQLEGDGANIGLGWQIDRDGRYWANGTTNGFHAFLGFDIKQRRGLVILASTAAPVVDQVSFRIYKILAGEQVPVPTTPTKEQLDQYAGEYDLAGSTLKMLALGNRLYVEGPGEPRMRMLPMSDHEFWIQSLNSVVVFERDSGKKVARAVFVVGDQQMTAPRKDYVP